MVSAKDRAHFQAIAEAEAESNASDLLADALRSPGENLTRGWALSTEAMAWAASFGAKPEEKVKVALITLWKQRGARDG